jgi:ATP-binding cassette subfamily B protein
MKKFLSYYKPYLKLFYTDMGCACGAALITLALPLCIRSIAQPGTPSSKVYAVGALMLGLVALWTLCHTFIDYQGHTMGARMEGDMRCELFEHYQKLSFNFYDDHRTGQLMTRISNDSFDLAELYHHGPEDLVISSLSFIGASVILLNINLHLGLIVIGFIPLMGVYGWWFSKKMRKALRKSHDRIGDINAQVEDSLSGIRVVQSFTNEEIETRKFAHENQRFVESRKVGYKSEAYFYDGLLTLNQLMTIALVVFGGVAIAKGSLDLADLLTFILYIGIIIEPIQKLGNFARLYQEGMAGFERFMEVLEVEPDIKDAAHALELAQPFGHIEFRNVSFKYKEGYNDVLKNLSLTIHAGEYVALVGVSGIGKTTLCSLIPRFYEVNHGMILVDGHNIQEVTLRSLRGAIGIVQQDVYLFAGTVLENIRYGKPHATQEEIVRAAHQANAHDFIMALPHGYATHIGQRGIKLSGGQKQRLSIARVFLKDPPILIFDEATSSLDNESERAIQNALEKLVQDRTTLVIAHRLSTVKNAQRIIVLTESGIGEQGSHEELIALKGTYANLYNMQLRI